MKIETQRLTLRRLEPADAEFVFAYRNDPKVARFQGWVPLAAQDVVDHALSLAPHALGAPEVWHQIVVVRTDDLIVLGDLAYMISGEQGDEAEIGVTLASGYQGVGYATEAVHALVRFLFDKLKVRRIVASIDPRNHPSIALFERLKFRQEGHFVESLWFKGELVDDVRYALLSRESKT